MLWKTYKQESFTACTPSTFETKIKLPTIRSIVENVIDFMKNDADNFQCRRAPLIPIMTKEDVDRIIIHTLIAN